jgi:small subunit ribosomal protein S21
VIYVKVKNNNIDFALRMLKRKVKDTGLLVELRERQFYIKPSTERREHINKVKLRRKYDKIRSTD